MIRFFGLTLFDIVDPRTRLGQPPDHVSKILSEEIKKMGIKINPVKTVKADRNRYCGPAVISAMTKMNTGEAARLLRDISGKPSVRGCYTHHVLMALSRCGITGKPIHNHLDRPTLTQWLKHYKADRMSGRVFLVVAGNHFQLIEGRRYVCGRTGEIVSVRDKRVKRRARVAEAFELVIQSEGKIKIPKEARKPKQDSNHSYVSRMKKKYDFDIEYLSSNHWFVAMNDKAESLAEKIDHDLAFEHYCYSIGEVAQRVEHMVEFMEDNFPQKTKTVPALAAMLKF